LVRERLVDDGELPRTDDFGLAKGPSGEELNFQNWKIAFAAKLKQRVPLFCVRLPQDFDVGRSASVGRQSAGFGGVDNSGQ
jgi:hypothetical protein